MVMDGLRGFRERLHDCFVRRADALFELCDAVLVASNAPSPAHLSLEAVHRRGWGSLYAALSRGEVDEGALRGLLARRSCASAGSAPYVYAVDISPWPRCDAETSPVLKATSTTPPATRRAGRSWRVGPTSSSRGSPSSATRGPPPRTPAA